MNKVVYLLVALSFVVGITLGSSINVIAQQASIPGWVKNTALWWGQNQISDAEFIKAIQWLIDQGFIKIPSQSAQNTNVSPTQSGSSSPATSNTSNGGILTNNNFLNVQNNADNFVNQWAKLQGTFTQDPYVDKDGTTWVLFNYAEGDTLDPNKQVWFSYTDSSVNLKSDDCAIAEGHVKGSGTIQYKLTGATSELPIINLEKLTKISCLDARYPAIKTINLEQSQTQGNIKVTIDKIVISQYYTIVFAKVANVGNPSGIDFSGGTIIQGQNQYDTKFGPFGITTNKLDFVTNIQNGVIDEGVLFFDPIGNQSFKLILKGIEGDSFTEDHFEFNVIP